MTVDSAIDSKRAILDAAEHLIMRHGLVGLSMRELSRESGLAKSTLYHYFQDKQQILLSVLEREIILIQEQLVAAAAVDGDHIARLRHVIQTYFRLHGERRSVIQIALREIGNLEEEMRSLARTHSRQLGKPFCIIVEGGIAAGLFRPLAVEMAVISLIGMLNGFVTHTILIEDGDIDEHVVDHVLDLFLHGIVRSHHA